MATFINPYNFVRPGKPSERAPYVSHKSFSGLSGVIRCSLKTLTPIFTPDPRTTSTDNRGRRDMKFFRTQGKLAVPAASLKGMIRSVAEAASNSCFSVFDDSYMLYRDIDARNKRAGIMHCGSDGRWFIEEVKEIVDRNRIISGADGDSIWLQTRGMHRHRRIVAETDDRQTSRCSEEGILKKYHKGPVGRWDNGFRIAVPIKCMEPYQVPEDVYERYHKVIGHPDFASEDMNSRDKEYLNNLDGSFVYFEPGHGNTVKSFGKNFHYKWAKRHGTAELLERTSPDFLPCTSRDKLCICCRMFGIAGNRKNGDGENQVAGRISFIDAEVEGDPPKNMPNEVLRTLGGPKSKYYPFYLIGDSGTAYPVKRYDQNDSLLRGRKFYWHHLPDIGYYREPPEKWHDKNATKAELIPDGVVFSFTVEFANLTEPELGLLLYSLELDGEHGKMAHKLGMGKPIGLGSIKITVENCCIESSVSRYTKSAASAPTKDCCIHQFKEYLKSVNGVTEFEDVINIIDMQHILNTDKLPSEVKYPPVPSRYNSSQGFRWFMDDHKRQPLPTPTDVRNNQNMLKEH